YTAKQNAPLVAGGGGSRGGDEGGDEMGMVECGSSGCCRTVVEVAVVEVADEVVRMMIWWLAENRWWPELFSVAAPEVERGEEDEMEARL
ncbi:hypothetical protein Tco_1560308, partial [Tanacetum coccineum]